MKELLYTEIGKPITKDNEETIKNKIEQMDWIDLPAKDVPFFQGSALKGVIKEWKIAAKKASFMATLANLSLYGLETKHQQMFFVDDGVSVTPIALRDL